MSTDSTAPLTLPGRASRAPVSLSREARYTLSTLAPAQPLPVVIQASVGGLGLPGWVAENAALVGRNAELAAEVRDLKKGVTALEERARSDLGMIASNETFYQVVPPRNDAADSRTRTAAAR